MFKIVSSSAGSGKTYTLTKEYLKLALGSPNSWYYKNILAITFTKAATREMKERIMGRLYDFSDIAKKDPMLTDIVHELYPAARHDPEGAYLAHERELRQRAGYVFTNILHNYSDFAVMTIDSFVQRIVSAFTDELNIPFAFEVEMDSDELLTFAVENLLEKAGNEAEQELTELLDDFYSDAGQEGENWHKIPSILVKFAGDLLSEQRYEAIKENQKLKPNDFKVIRRQVRDFTKKIEKEAIALAKNGLKIIEDTGLEEKDFSRGTAFKFFAKRTNANQIFETLGKLESDLFDEDSGWYTKTARPFVRDAIEQIKPQLFDIYDKIEAIKSEHLPKYQLFKQIYPRLYQMSLLNQIKVEFDRQLSENGRVHISEFNRKILKIVTEDPVPFIYERMGEKFQHILIDEFQDTSKLQFANLLPLIENNLGYDMFNLAVGDSKQAIYRFRGGDMEQIVGLHGGKIEKMIKSSNQNDLTMERLQNIWPHRQPDALNTNRRSAKAVVEFNNDFFGEISTLHADTYKAVGDVFNENFKQLTPPNASDNGHVQIEFIEKNNQNDETEGHENMLARVHEIIENTIAQGFSLGDIAILCRRISEAKNIANYLKDRGYAIVSEDSLSLVFSGAINLLTAFMKILVKPDDRLKKYEAVYLFYQNILKKIPTNEENEAIKEAVEAHDVHLFYDFINQRNNASSKKLEPYKLLQLTSYELTEQLAEIFELFELQNERDYLFRFFDVILEFGVQKGNHLNDFLDYWQKKQYKVSISSPSDTNAITIQTIHKSKGLEYPVVILPYAHWSFMPSAQKDSLWVHLEAHEQELRTPDFYNTDGLMIAGEALKAASVVVKEALLDTPVGVARQYYEEVEKTLLDNLNLLYVAFTRPTRQLYVLANKAKFATQKSPSRISYWLYWYLTQNELWQDDKNVFVINKASKKHISEHKKTVGDVEIIETVISNDRSREMRLRRLADRIFDVETFERKKDHGNKIHRALEFIRSPQDIETALMKLQIEGLTEPNEAEEIRNSIAKILQHPDLQEFFSIETSVRNEREILTPDGKMHRPDRVVQLPYRTVIIDYKTGQPSDSHQTQIRRYMALYRDMGFENVEGKLVYIEQNEVMTIGDKN